jgi:hypothetical protein
MNETEPEKLIEFLRSKFPADVVDEAVIRYLIGCERFRRATIVARVLVELDNTKE